MDEKTEIVSRNFNQLLPKEQDVIEAISYKELNLSAASRRLCIPRNTLRYRYEKGIVHLRSAIIKDVGIEKVDLLMNGEQNDDEFPSDI
jgi:DNA-directed RNA polymerase specialized sigma24 family protein